MILNTFWELWFQPYCDIRPGQGALRRVKTVLWRMWALWVSNPGGANCIIFWDLVKAENPIA